MRRWTTLPSRWRTLPICPGCTRCSDAALHIGPIHIVFDITAHELAEQVTGTDRIQVENWYVMFVKPGLIGPFRCEGEAITSRKGRINVNLTLFDEGRDNRTITTGSAVFRVV